MMNKRTLSDEDIIKFLEFAFEKPQCKSFNKLAEFLDCTPTTAKRILKDTLINLLQGIRKNIKMPEARDSDSVYELFTTNPSYQKKCTNYAGVSAKTMCNIMLYIKENYLKSESSDKEEKEKKDRRLQAALARNRMNIALEKLENPDLSFRLRDVIPDDDDDEEENQSTPDFSDLESFDEANEEEENRRNFPCEDIKDTDDPRSEHRFGIPILTMHDPEKALTNDRISLFMSNVNLITGKTDIPVRYFDTECKGSEINCVVLSKKSVDADEYRIIMMHVNDLLLYTSI